MNLFSYPNQSAQGTLDRVNNKPIKANTTTDIFTDSDFFNLEFAMVIKITPANIIKGCSTAYNFNFELSMVSEVNLEKGERK